MKPIARKFDKSYYDSALRYPSAIEELQALFAYKDLVEQVIARSIKTRYKRSTLGVVWTMLNPLMTMLVLTLVFSSLFRFDIPHYPVYLLSGLMIWNYFSSSTRQAMGEIIYNSELLKRIFIPKSVFIVAAIGTGLVNLVLTFIPLVLIALFTGMQFHLSVFLTPFSILLLTIFSLGVGLFTAAISVFFADMLPIYDVLLTIWIYATPIIYPISIIPDKWLWLFKLNPLYYLVEIFRQPFFEGRVPSLETWAIAILVSLVSLIIGWLVFTSKSDEYGYRV